MKAAKKSITHLDEANKEDKMAVPIGKEWCVYFEYADGFSKRFYGPSENYCMDDGINYSGHGEVTYYTVVNDEYYVDGQWCPEEEREY